MSTLQISELFLSIQGESSYAGRPCGFVRLTGCPLRCEWCDSTYAFDGGDTRTVEEILAEVAEWNVSLVEVTGGEPLHQEAVHMLLRGLCDAAYDVLLETSGAFPVEHIDPRVVTILDIKCPGSGESDRNLWENLHYLKGRDEIKFVIKDRADFDWAAEVIRTKTALEHRTLLFSPVHNVLDPADLAAWIIEARLRVHLQLQLHKYLWPGVERGV